MEPKMDFSHFTEQKLNDIALNRGGVVRDAIQQMEYFSEPITLHGYRIRKIASGGCGNTGQIVLTAASKNAAVKLREGKIREYMRSFDLSRENAEKLEDAIRASAHPHVREDEVLTYMLDHAHVRVFWKGLQDVIHAGTGVNKWLRKAGWEHFPPATQTVPRLRASLAVWERYFPQ